MDTIDIKPVYALIYLLRENGKLVLHLDLSSNVSTLEYYKDKLHHEIIGFEFEPRIIPYEPMCTYNFTFSKGIDLLTINFV